MWLRQWLRPPRRTLTLFLTLTVALAGALGLAAATLVRQDRDVEEQRAQARVARDVDLLTVSLRNWLNEIELKLNAFPVDADRGDKLDPRLSWIGDDGAVAAFGRSRMSAWPRERFPSDADAAVSHKSGATRVDDLIARARTLRAQGQAAASLDVYGQLLRDDTPLLNGVPAALVARHARATVLADLGRAADLRREAEQLAAATRAQLLRLSYGQYAFYSSEARRWLDASLDASSPQPIGAHESLALVAGDLWEAWQDGRTRNGPLADRRVVWGADRPYIVVAHTDPDRLLTYFGGPDAIRRILEINGFPPTGSEAAVALTDSAGRAVVGAVPAVSSGRVVRTLSESGLPWTIYGVRPSTDAETAVSLSRRRTIVAGATLVIVCVLLTGAMTARAMHRELETGRIQSDFVAAVSHEFRTPLAAFEQVTELLVDERVPSAADRQEFYVRLHRESRRLRRLVEDLLDFRRMEAGAREYRMAPVSIDPLVASVVDSFCGELAARRPAIETSFHCPGTLVNADEQAIARALWNLLDNAVKYAPRAPVSVETESGDGFARIAVRDAGPGIPANRQLDVFKKFVRATTPDTASIAGTGLGLAMVRHAAEAHGGAVTLVSEAGRGTVFTLSLPIAARGEIA